MIWKGSYDSPLGRMVMAADENGLKGLWFHDQKYFKASLLQEAVEQELPVFVRTGEWLDCYFSGKIPEQFPTLDPSGTGFQKEIWNLLLKIPYGEVVTYGELAKVFAGQKGLSSMSAQAVGGAVSHNPISILIPCHRVLGAGGKLTGYAGGLERKKALLKLEKQGRILGSL
jgi:methylated-DNA-[protein]-cysteine S-methyltransferase